MEIGAILVGFAILVFCVPFITRPFMKGRPGAAAVVVKTPGTGTSKKEQRQKVLFALRDLDFDFQTGKITTEDHHALRAQLLSEAARLTADRDEEDDEIEALIRARMQSLANKAKCRQCGAEVDVSDRFCPACGAVGDGAGVPSVAAFCPGCGTKTLENASFCAHCGTRLAPEEPVRANE